MHKFNDLTIWKIIRTLSAFKDIKVIEPLMTMLKNHPEPSIRWEAGRSIGLVGNINSGRDSGIKKCLAG